MPIWPTLSNLTGHAEVKTFDKIHLYSDLGPVSVPPVSEKVFWKQHICRL